MPSNDDALLHFGTDGDYLVVGEDGWCLVRCARLEASGALGWVAITAGPDARLSIDAVVVTSDERGPTRAALDAFPLEDIEAALTVSDGQEPRGGLRQLEGVVLANRPWDDEAWTPDEGNQFRRFLESFIPPYDEPVRTRPKGVRLKLKVPSTKPYPDSFYESVAAAHLELSTRFRYPVKHLADINGVTSYTAHWWVREARVRAAERGTLAPAPSSR